MRCGPSGRWGAVAGFATLVEFLLPARHRAGDRGLSACAVPALEPKHAALGAYLVFMALNIVGVHIAATFELVVTLLAVGELLVFMGVVWPAFSFSHFTAGGWAGRIISAWRAGGIFAALPFAIWFFLAIEGVAMAAEEAKEPRRTIPIAYITGILTLTVLAFGVMVPGGSGDWRSLANLNDPLPQAMKRAVGASSGWLHMLVWLGLFGLVASSGIIMGYARQIFALGRAGYLPPPSPPAPALQTPHIATLAGGMVGIATIYSDTLVQIAGPVADGKRRHAFGLRGADDVHRLDGGAVSPAPRRAAACPPLQRAALSAGARLRAGGGCAGARHDGGQQPRTGRDLCRADGGDGGRIAAAAPHGRTGGADRASLKSPFSAKTGAPGSL
jgi:spore maturation protein SpmA